MSASEAPSSIAIDPAARKLPKPPSPPGRREAVTPNARIFPIPL
jgi:hypothetical protein